MAGLLPDGPLDSLGVLDAIQATPEAVAAARDADLEVPPFAGVHGMVLAASGADALVAHAARALVQPWSPVPVFVHTGRGMPGFVSDEWRCVFISRGPTVEAREALRAAVDHRAVLTAVGSGEIVETAAELDAAVVRLTDQAPAPRYSFAPTLAATLRLLDGLGAISTPLGGGGIGEALDAAVDQLTRRRNELDGAGDAARLARRIGRLFPLIYGAGPLGAVVARRWKAQVNESAKAPAFANALPDVVHDELSGWGQDGDVTRQVFSMIELRHDHEHPGDVEQFRRVDALLEEVVHERHEVSAEGEGALAQLLDLVLIGDLTSYHLAQEYEIDPGPTSVGD